MNAELLARTTKALDIVCAAYFVGLKTIMEEFEKTDPSTDEMTFMMLHLQNVMEEYEGKL